MWELPKKAIMEHKRRMAEHEIMQAEEKRQQDLRDLSNAETRRKYLDGLESQKAEKRKLADIELDRELEPQKQILMRQWIADQPGKTSSDFERLAWPHLRENLIAERKQAILEETRLQMSQMYQL